MAENVTPSGVFEEGSIARGLAVVVGIAALGLALQQGIEAWGAEVGSPWAVCDTPVEIVTAGNARLACGDDPSLLRCPALRAGDRVTLPGCQVSSMKAAARMLVGLPLDLNRASADDLRLLDGIGPKKAAAIVADRDAQGPFGSIAELARVRGIGPATVEKLRGSLSVGEP